MEPTIFLLFGYPGAGKTTTAKLIAQQTGAVHLSSDDLRGKMFPKPTFSEAEHDQLYKELDKQAELLLMQRKSVVYDANLNRYQHRLQKYQLASRANGRVLLLWVQTPKEIAKQRAADTSRQHLVPPEETANQMFDRIANLIEPPQADEQPIIIDGTKVTPEYIAQVVNL
jgi:predicted kinase